MPAAAKENKASDKAPERVPAMHSTDKGIALRSGRPSNIRPTSAGRPHDVQRTQRRSAGRNRIPMRGVRFSLFMVK